MKITPTVLYCKHSSQCVFHSWGWTWVVPVAGSVCTAALILQIFHTYDGCWTFHAFGLIWWIHLFKKLFFWRWTAKQKSLLHHLYTVNKAFLHSLGTLHIFHFSTIEKWVLILLFCWRSGWGQHCMAAGCPEIKDKTRKVVVSEIVVNSVRIQHPCAYLSISVLLITTVPECFSGINKCILVYCFEIV